MKTKEELETALVNLEAERKDIDATLDACGGSGAQDEVGALLRAQAKNSHQQEMLRWVLDLI